MLFRSVEPPHAAAVDDGQDQDTALHRLVQDDVRGVSVPVLPGPDSRAAMLVGTRLVCALFPWKAEALKRSENSALTFRPSKQWERRGGTDKVWER